jgi:hypothetical protein
MKWCFTMSFTICNIPFFLAIKKSMWMSLLCWE